MEAKIVLLISVHKVLVATINFYLLCFELRTLISLLRNAFMQNRHRIINWLGWLGGVGQS